MNNQPRINQAKPTINQNRPEKKENQQKSQQSATTNQNQTTYIRIYIYINQKTIINPTSTRNFTNIQACIINSSKSDHLPKRFLFRQTCHFDVSKTERLEPGTSSRALCGVALELNGQRALVGRFVSIAGVFWEGIQ